MVGGDWGKKNIDQLQPSMQVCENIKALSSLTEDRIVNSGSSDYDYGQFDSYQDRLQRKYVGEPQPKSRRNIQSVILGLSWH